MKKWGILCVTLYLIGLSCVMCFMKSVAFLGNEYHMQNFAVQEFDRIDLFCEVLWKRWNLFLIVLALLATPLRKWVPLFLCAMLSLLGGIYQGICVLCFGIRGIEVFFLSVFPHGIVYAVAVITLINLFQEKYYYKKKDKLKKILMLFAIGMMIFVGALLEVWTFCSALQKLLFSIS